jgi:K+-sensing histidine kinase KdpD
VKPSQLPYFIAAAYSLAVAAIGIFVFQPPPPRFMDLFLVGIALTTARWSWGPALLMYCCSLLTVAWILPPNDSFAVTEGHDQLRMALYGITAIVIMSAVEYAKRRGKRGE